MADNSFIASDAFGDFFFFGSFASSCEQGTSGSSARSPGSTGTGAAVFMFPVRSRVAPPKNQLPSSSSVDSKYFCSLDPAVDATATLVLRPPKPESSRDRKPGPSSDDVAASLVNIHSKSDAPSGERGYGRSTSLDTGNAHCHRDQHLTDRPLASPTDGNVGRSPSSFNQEDLFLNSQVMVARRSDSIGGSVSGGVLGGAHHHHHHHNGWHSTEWWRSFSSSRLNEMMTEEPDKRSPEMRKVPYVGGAEPMYALVHGSSDDKCQ